LLEADDAITSAKAPAAAQGWDLTEYEEPVAQLEGGSWVVRFEGREPRPGNHLVVLVDAATGAAEVWPGK
jgi:hypothetical protein